MFFLLFMCSHHSMYVPFLSLNGTILSLPCSRFCVDGKCKVLRMKVTTMNSDGNKGGIFS